MRSFCIFSQKGGVGKTTTAMTLADALSRTFVARKGETVPAHVLVIDADKQRTAFKWESRSVNAGFSRFPVRVEAVSRMPDTESWAKEVMARIDIATQSAPLDYLIIDTQPDIDGVELEGALSFVDVAILPFNCHTGCVEAFEEIVPLINKIKHLRQKPLDVRVLVNKYSLKTNAERAFFNSIEAQSPWPVLSTRLKDLAHFRDAQNYKTSLYEFKKSDARGYADALAKELITMKS